MYDLPAMLDAVNDLLANLTGVEHSQIGVPLALEQRLEAWVTVGPIANQNKSVTLLQREVNCVCGLGYTVGGEEDQAELALATAIDDLTATFYRTRGRAGVPGTGVFNEDLTGVISGALELEVAGAADYLLRAGEELRQYAFILRLTQQANVTDFDA